MTKCTSSFVLTYFCLFAICALTWASTFVGSCTASVPNTLIKLAMRTGKLKHKSNHMFKLYENTYIDLLVGIGYFPQLYIIQISICF